MTTDRAFGRQFKNIILEAVLFGNNPVFTVLETQVFLQRIGCEEPLAKELYLLKFGEQAQRQMKRRFDLVGRLIGPVSFLQSRLTGGVLFGHGETSIHSFPFPSWEGN